jgi:hypothetical protein
MEFPWPGYDEAPPAPIVINAGRPGRNRPRLSTEHAVPRQAQVLYGRDGQLYVPAPGGHYRSSSVSNSRPAQVIINNENLAALDDPPPRHPHSVYHDYDIDRRYRSRSGSRPRYRDRSRSRSRYDRHSRSTSSHDEDFDMREKLKRLEELDRREEEERREKLKRLEEMERKEEEARRERRLKEKFALEKAKMEAEEAQKKREEHELKTKAIEEYKAKEEKERAKKKKEQEEADEQFATRMRKTLKAKGYSDAQIEKILDNKEKDKKDKHAGAEGSKVLTLSRPTYIRVRRKHLDPETLDLYQLPWEWDETDESFIIIKTWIPERDQEILFEHTRKLQEQRQLTLTTTELRKERDQLLLIRKKEPRKKSPSRNWLLT